jgi:hypothetical protein
MRKSHAILPAPEAGGAAGPVYLHSMAEPPRAPVPPEQPPPAAGEKDREYGPLTVTRHAKDDGRELILYTRRRQS